MHFTIIKDLQDLRESMDNRIESNVCKIGEIELQIDNLRLEIEYLKENISERENVIKEIDKLLKINS